MMQKLIITKIQNGILSALLQDDKIIELHCSPYGKNKAEPGNIYIGRVSNIVKNIQAAFIDIGDGNICYYSMKEKYPPVFTHKIGGKPLCIGDELLVQISKEAVKTKVPTVTGKLNFTGKYAVLTHADSRIGYSSKLDADRKAQLKAIMESYHSDEYGWILRTNAGGVSKEILCAELDNLAEQYRRVLTFAKNRTCFSCMKQAPPAYLTELRDVYQNQLDEIVVGDPQIYDEVRDFLSANQPEDMVKLRHYQDPQLPLHKLYGLEKHLEDALKEKVWMKSGAYLVIQPTEALTVIDVNSGRAINNKSNEEMWLSCNIEAANEAARQIRLRNLSGIILIDFINMKRAEHTQELLKILQKELKKDPIETILVDMTKLQLVEITRKKIRKPLKEAFEDLQDDREEMT